MKLAFFAIVPTLLAQVPPAKDLARQVVENEMRKGRDMMEYTAQYEWIVRDFSKSGKLEKETSHSGEVYVSNRRTIDIPLVRDGKPLKPKDLEKQRKAAADRLMADAAEHDKTGDRVLTDDRFGPGTTFFGIHTSAVDALRLCRLSETREILQQWAVDFSDCRTPPWPEGAHYPHLSGTLLIDPPTRTIVSWKAWIRDGPKAGALFIEHDNQPAPGGVLVISSIHVNYAAAPHLFPKVRAETIYRWKNPQRFEVNVDQTIAAPKQ